MQYPNRAITSNLRVIASTCRVVPWLRLVEKEDTTLSMPQDMVVTAQTWQQVQPRFPFDVLDKDDGEQTGTQSFLGLEKILSIPLLSKDKALLSQLRAYGCTEVADLILMDGTEELRGFDAGRISRRWTQLGHLSRCNCLNLKDHFDSGFRLDTFGSLVHQYLQNWGSLGYMYVTKNSTCLCMQYLVLQWAESAVVKHGKLFGNAQSLDDLVRVRIEPLESCVEDGLLQPLMLRKVRPCISCYCYYHCYYWGHASIIKCTYFSPAHTHTHTHTRTHTHTHTHTHTQTTNFPLKACARQGDEDSRWDTLGPALGLLRKYGLLSGRKVDDPAFHEPCVTENPNPKR